MTFFLLPSPSEQVRSHTHFLPISREYVPSSMHGGHCTCCVDLNPEQLASPISKFFTPSAIDLGAEARFFGEMADS